MTTLEAWSVDEGVRRASERFGSAFDEAPAVVTLAPGRVNLIGEHTDYNGGLCLPIALPHATYAAATARDDGRIRLVSGEQRGPGRAAARTSTAARGWAGVRRAASCGPSARRGTASTGWTWRCRADVPLGAGLSSSAALECSVGWRCSRCSVTRTRPALRRTLADAGHPRRDRGCRRADGRHGPDRGRARHVRPRAAPGLPVVGDPAGAVRAGGGRPHPARRRHPRAPLAQRRRLRVAAGRL